jgi:iron(III) transport system permease protein
MSTTIRTLRNPKASMSTAVRTGRNFRTSSIVLILVLILLVVLPIAVLLYTSLATISPEVGGIGKSLTFTYYRSLLSGEFFDAMRNSILIGLCSTAIAILIGSGLAWMAARTDIPFKPLVQVAGTVPLFLPTLVGALAWSNLASPNQGYINIILRSIHAPVHVSVNSIYGISFVLGLYYASYVYLAVYSSLTLSNPDLEEAALVNGASIGRTTFSITWPLCAPAIYSAGLLVFLLSFENFPVALILAQPARIATLPGYIINLMLGAPPQTGLAAAIGVVMLLVMAIILYFQRRYLAAREYATVTGKGLRVKELALGKWRIPVVAGAAIYLGLSVLLPILALVEMAFRTVPFIDGARDLVDPSKFGLSSYHQLMDAGALQPLENTTIIAVLVAVGGVLITTAMALKVVRSRSVGSRIVAYIGMVPVAVPALVLGLCIFWTWLLIPSPLYGTLLLMAIAFISRFIPIAYTNISSSLRRVHRDLEDSALVCGASKLRAATQVTLPLIRSSVVASALLLFILSFHEISAAIFLYTPSTNVISLMIYQEWSSGSVGVAAILCLLMSCGLAVVVGAMRKFLSIEGIENASE